MITVGIVGCGFVGWALKTCLEENNREVKVVVNAFAKLTAGSPLGELLAPLHGLNVKFRGFEERI